MIKKKKRISLHAFLYSFLTLWLISVQWMTWVHPDGLKKTNQRYAAFLKPTEKSQVMAKKNKLLRDEIDLFESHPGRVEGLARESLNMIKPGETFYAIVPKPSAQDADSLPMAYKSSKHR
jgi:cell division protein FtsB